MSTTPKEKEEIVKVLAATIKIGTPQQANMAMNVRNDHFGERFDESVFS